ncbi:hypothetical protein [Bremerella alba]|uniref:Uncharacterized protein n=1 Tax=Bremerella alba TaxID=980252 RepID=A0A7V8V9B6_9BACT|nr:hypothetical protein [Bremerella alba]MBA2117313.1 hypothetical protein [Bremerella alba]
MKRTQNMMKTKQPRRGALLLVVLSILVLFAMVGLTFVVAALAFNTGAQANLERDIQQAEAPNEADAVMMQLLRGPRAGTLSSTLGHDILRDMWGNQSVVINDDSYPSTDATTIARPQDSAGTDINQLWEIEVAEDVADDAGLFRVEQYYTGSVLTFISGELKGQSHRILQYREKFDTSGTPAVAQGVVFVIDQDPIVARENLIDIDGDGGINPSDGDDFVVNDPPFNGTGYGFNPEEPTGTNKRTLNLRDVDDDPVALLPNILGNFPTGMASGYSIEAGGADEPYDVADYQNMFLAFLPQEIVQSTTATVQDKTEAILPSFHRQDLIEYWFAQLVAADSSLSMLDDLDAFLRNPNIDTSSWSTAPTNAQITAVKQIRRKIILRPLIEDHPNFTGSNPNFDILAATPGARWDIDNDLDGVNDSIWIDVGLPLKTDSQGRRYKPLAAILVKDMDGLINLNTHGFYTQFESFENGTFPPTGAATDAETLLPAMVSGSDRHSLFSPSWDATGPTAQDMQLVLGSGYGPAEVSLRGIFSAEEAFDLINSRYAGMSGYFSNPGTPGENAIDDVRSRMDTLGLLGDFNTATGLWPTDVTVIPNFLVDNRFGTPSDRLGMGRTYIDYAGRPRFQPEVQGNRLGKQIPPAGFTERTDDPYESDPLHGYRYDSPYSYQELERIVRYEEYDSGQISSGISPDAYEDRLLNLATAAFTSNATPAEAATSAANRRLVTTSSFQVPTANRVDIPFDQRSEDSSGTPLNMMLDQRADTARRPAPTLVTLLQERLREENSWDPTNANHKLLLNEKIHQLLPPEIMRGEPFDLNRILEAPADAVADNVFDLQNASTATIAFPTNPTGGTTSDISYSQFINGIPGSNGVGSNSPSLPAINTNNPTSYSASRQMMARYLYVMVLLLMEPDYVLPMIDTSLTPAEQEELTKRRIAQWAINVVDFRDRDAVMTPFEYDLNPFTDDVGAGNNDPWNVDGNLATEEDILFRRVVWGAEAPELMLSETLAFHDRRTKDTKWDPDGKSRFTTTDPDEDLDQYRIPQGSLFIEMYNPRNMASNNSYFPPELYDVSTATFGLALDRKTSGGDPVWRIIITQTELETNGGTRTNLVDEIATRPDTINFQPLDSIANASDPASDPGFLAMDGTSLGSKENYDIDRIIYFTTPPGAPAENEFYYPGAAARRIVPDSYSVIGPRKTTYIGSKPTPMMGMPDYKSNIPGSQSIVLSGDSEGVYTSTNMISPTGARNGVNQDFAVVASAPPSYDDSAAENDPDGLPGGGSFSTIGIGLSVTEPLRDTYYPEPTIQNVAPNLDVIDLYTDGDIGADAAVDVPFDTSEVGTTPAGPFQFPLSASATIGQTGTTPRKSSKSAPDVIKDYKTAILQRLANPLCDHHATLNPYISVDHLGIDVTVFNGEDSFDAAAGLDMGMGSPPAENEWDPDENNTDPRASNEVYFASREKGRREDDNPANNPGIAELEGDATTPSFSSGNHFSTIKRWTSAMVGNVTELIPSFNQTPPIHPSPLDDVLVTDVAETDEHFGRKVVHTLGYVNHNLGAQIGTGVAAIYQPSPNPLETGRRVDPYDNSTMPVVINCENNPLAYINWPNAPFVSEYDLMMVPTSSPQRLLFEYSRARKDNSNVDIPMFFESGSTDGESLDARFAPFANLFNFFHSSRSQDINPADPLATNLPRMAMQMSRLFDFVHVPSRYNGTNKWFNMSQFNPDSTDLRKDPLDNTKTTDARLGYMFPFHRRSEFREPGKINLNTIPTESVFNSIFDTRFWQSNPGLEFATWAEFQESRQGYLGTTHDTTFPSRFSQPFRPAAAAEMMAELNDSTGAADPKLQVSPVEAGLLRSKPGASPVEPLFDLRLTTPGLGNDEMRHYRTDDNPMLRYQAYQRLGNLTGTQSNVFAVWITIGYFEVEPATVDATHPDGWSLGQELGNDTGEINRHRAFYIIDRSVPVGYMPGEDMNVEDTIMLKRFIE